MLRWCERRVASVSSVVRAVGEKWCSRSQFSVAIRRHLRRLRHKRHVWGWVPIRTRPKRSKRCTRSEIMPRGSGRWRSRRAKRRLLLVWLAYRRLKQRRAWRSVWVRPIFARRRSQGEYHNLLQELRSTDPESHIWYLRMSKEGFDVLLSKVLL